MSLPTRFDEEPKFTLPKNNVSNHNGFTGEGYGVVIWNGTNNIIQNNVTNNNNFGIRLSGQGRNKVLNNSVSGNTGVGIWLTEIESGTRVLRNTVLGSGEIDMLEDSVGCDSNIWQNNTFQTDLVAGVPNGGPWVPCLQ